MIMRERKESLALKEETVVRAIRRKVRVGLHPTGTELQEVIELAAEKLPQFVSRIQQLYPSVSQSNILLCVLTRLGFSPKEQAVAIGISQQAVSNRRKRLNQLLFKRTTATTKFDYSIRHL